MTNQNEIIAQFMGIEKCDRCVDDCGQYKFGPGNYCNPSQMQYGSSWDWLMPCIEKIESLGYWFTITADLEKITPEYRHEVRVVNLDHNPRYRVMTNAETKIDCAYNAAVKFIKHYNSLTTNK